MEENKKARITVNKAYPIDQVDKRIYGSFLEHVGRAIYTGIYEPGHATADEEGWRKDVLETVKALDVPVVRYPGGNFVSGYNWKDGIGPRDQRPTRLELAARIIETNEIGVDEFVRWAEKADTDVMMTVNLGTQGIDNARELVEYCNFPGGSYWSDLRIKNGGKDPYNVKVWCLGNEMDGPWQMGQKEAREYGNLAAQAGKCMKLVDPSIELVLSGSAATDLPTFPSFDAEVLDRAYDYVDYICLHAYYKNVPRDDLNFLARNMHMDQYIRTMVGICDYVKAKHRGKKDVMLSFDEWNVWYHSYEADTKIVHWTKAPAQSEEDYNMLDALVFGSCFLTLIKHCDRVKMALVAQLVNVLAPIISLPGGDCYVHTTYYPYLHVSKYGRGTAYETRVEGPAFDCTDYKNVPYVDSVTVVSEDEKELTVFAVNKDVNNDMPISLALQGFGEYEPIEHILLTGELDAYNTPENPRNVVPESINDVAMKDGVASVTLPKASWNVLRFKKEGC
ncbi:MAG: alpha-N-arabinofuranosidase [Clostridia bacterium]|nr:alpha-N-arabinofuranosidase [Clostridia bacterium]